MKALRPELRQRLIDACGHPTARWESESFERLIEEACSRLEHLTSRVKNDEERYRLLGRKEELARADRDLHRSNVLTLLRIIQQTLDGGT